MRHVVFAEIERKLPGLRAKLDHLDTRLDVGCVFLNALAQRIGQDSPEFERYSAEWLHIEDEPEAVCDQIIVLEARKKLAERLKTATTAGKAIVGQHRKSHSGPMREFKVIASAKVLTDNVEEGTM